MLALGTANYTVMVTNLPKDMTQYELEKKLKYAFAPPWSLTRG